ncbi:MAG: hypothetical protein AVDCRST_MAG04-934, partial [uncultured Acetobacteraceae bacterium]
GSIVARCQARPGRSERRDLPGVRRDADGGLPGRHNGLPELGCGPRQAARLGCRCHV